MHQEPLGGVPNKIVEHAAISKCSTHYRNDKGLEYLSPNWGEHLVLEQIHIPAAQSESRFEIYD